MSQKLHNNLKVSEKIIQLQDDISPNQQLFLVNQIFDNNILGQEALLELLIKRRIIKQFDASCLDGILFQVLIRSEFEIIQQGLKNYFPNGLIKFNLAFDLDYQNLQKLLQQQHYQEADRLTQLKLCKLVGLTGNEKRDWLYFTDISLIPSDDLLIIDLLWQIYSREQFGFSKQRQIWLANNCNWEKFWQKIGWTSDNQHLRYPNEFNWSLNAPNGHLPLFNQLRGVQVLSALFNHKAWNK
nr:hypothetical protein [Calliblepharis sp.]